MKVGKRWKMLTAAVAALGIVCLSGTMVGRAAAADAAPAKPVLTSADCVKCHTKPVEDIEAKGMSHKTAVSCQDCHVGHPPAVKKIIPQCSMCHQDKPHFKLPNCLGCHRNPHTPKVITFGKNVTDPCLTCHTPQIKKLQENKSKHTALNCSFCHDVHGKIPACTQCHKSHSADIVQADCKKCHQAHMPKVVTYGKEMPNKFCGACHAKAFNLLSASKAKHSKVPCVSCHQAKHKMIPKCQDCHGIPHPAAMMSKFPKCGECHNIAHDLNNWPSEKKAGEKKEERKPAKKR
ncbi:MAG TPA: cytochrome C [Geobacteraceae bacterium]